MSWLNNILGDFYTFEWCSQYTKLVILYLSYCLKCVCYFVSILLFEMCLPGSFDKVNILSNYLHTVKNIKTLKMYIHN
jgi:hypothetical protein